MFGWTEKSAADATASTAARIPASGASKSATTSATTDDGSAGVDDNDELLSMPVNTKVVTSTDLYVQYATNIIITVYSV